LGRNLAKSQDENTDSTAGWVSDSVTQQNAGLVLFFFAPLREDNS